MKKFKFVLAALIFFQTAVAQQKKKDCICKAIAYSEERIQGNIPVDQQGKPIGPSSYTVYTVYLEVPAKVLPTVKELTKGKEQLILEVVEELPDQTVNVGIQMGGSKQIILKSDGTNRLWKIQSSLAQTSNSDRDKTNPPIILKGSCNNQYFTRSINQITPLESIPLP